MNTREIIMGQVNKLRVKANEKRRQGEAKLREADKFDAEANKLKKMADSYRERLEEITDEI